MPLRYNLNPAIKQTTGRTAPITRVDFLGIAEPTRALTPFSGDVFTYEIHRRNAIRRPQPAGREAARQQLGARACRTGSATAAATPAALPTAVNDFQVLDERNLELNEGPTNLDRRHTVTLSGRVEVPWIRGLDRQRRRAHDDRAAVHDSQQQRRRESQ